MARYKKLIISLVVLTLILVAFTFLSYCIAKRKAADIMAAVKNELQLKSCTLSPFYFKDKELQDRITSIGWKVAYNTDQYFIIHDVEIYVSLLGKVEMTNPKDLQERIIKMLNQK